MLISANFLFNQIYIGPARHGTCVRNSGFQGLHHNKLWTPTRFLSCNFWLFLSVISSLDHNHHHMCMYIVYGRLLSFFSFVFTLYTTKLTTALLFIQKFVLGEYLMPQHVKKIVNNTQNDSFFSSCLQIRDINGRTFFDIAILSEMVNVCKLSERKKTETRNIKFR